MDDLVIHPVAQPSLYGQITADLLRRITAGELPPGAALPTEAQMCRQYGVSRITVRRAVADLVARRLVVRRAGVGSFVSARPEALREFHLTGFLDEKREHSSRTLLNTAVPADAAVAAALGLAPGAAVRHIRTVVLRGGIPFTVADAYTADQPELRLHEEDYRADVPVAAAMGLRLGRRVERAEQVIDAVAADAVVARHLGLRRGAPILRTRRTYFGADSQALQYLVVRYHPERYAFTAELLPRGYATAPEPAGLPARGGPVPGAATRRRGRPRRTEIT